MFKKLSKSQNKDLPDFITDEDDMKWERYTNEPMMRYKKVLKIVETDEPDPIQGFIRDPKDIYKFLKEISSDAVQKVRVILLDESDRSMGSYLVSMGTEIHKTKKSLIIRPVINFTAVKYFIVSNKPNGIPYLSDEDKAHIAYLKKESPKMADSELVDVVVVAGDTIWSMRENNTHHFFMRSADIQEEKVQNK